MATRNAHRVGRALSNWYLASQNLIFPCVLHSRGKHSLHILQEAVHPVLRTRKALSLPQVDFFAANYHPKVPDICPVLLDSSLNGLKGTFVPRRVRGPQTPGQVGFR
ncbi:hypothetical protein N7536_008315 [Penicillium majusculum]|uniref:Uncharacterized protein n=1 Tax=Penicillium solitum TaxID=60172 RepID=A0A1V6R931_9EURO|nr:uncharacterized protein PENSOL_c011G09279 [Penicillium solitum]KAJ5685696.1 hypothetical protein N7536_008315 [Penicillium majusculum]OQD97702.1 hypothetical protein PENSOL_c011G09279 [Penicillium solitum]